MASLPRGQGTLACTGRPLHYTTTAGLLSKAQSKHKQQSHRQGQPFVATGRKHKVSILRHPCSAAALKHMQALLPSYTGWTLVC
jgi:hypothetical protein